ncbi:MAG: ribonuclease P protein component 4 [Candidatus Njordarchaeales archaeon]
MLQYAFLEGYKCRLERSLSLGFHARRLAKSVGVKIPKRFKYFYCKKCKNFLIPGKTMRIRLRQRREPHITITCLLCGSIKRIPIKHR